MIYELELINVETELDILIKEADELVSIVVASIKTVKKEQILNPKLKKCQTKNVYFFSMLMPLFLEATTL